ncbi:MAG TPA: polyphosphate kinase 1 [Acidimicrobiales bacterium]|nr:polyphosphate kinase 1 [Acidimicrobiales bacterium]
MTGDLREGSAEAEHRVPGPSSAHAGDGASGHDAPRGPEEFGAARFLNRELSWLDFAARVLDLAADVATPLLERGKFLAIFATGMDEFFQVRVAGLKDRHEAGLRARSADGRTVSEQLRAIRARAGALAARAERIYRDGLVLDLAASAIEIVSYSALDEDARAELRGIFERDIFPVLTPLAVDPGHPFPYISNLSLNLAVVVADPETSERRFARVKVPPLLPRFVALGDDRRLVLLEQVIAAHLDQLFPDMVIGAHHAFRVTRNADLDLDDGEADDLLAAVEIELRRRRFGRAVRLEVDASIEPDVLELLLSELELTTEDVYACTVPLDLGQLWAVVRIDRPELHEPAWIPATQPRLAGHGEDPVDLFAVLRERDVLVQHPYDSFGTSVEAFISAAAEDPDVLAIKQTLYRTSGDAPFVSALARAAESGKQVAALVELKARFDEQRNIVWARQLEQAGVHVVYGVVGLKTHSKTALVVRREPDGIRRYCHVGTGNYNSDTARVYEDIGLLTSDPDVGADLNDLFNHLTGFSRSSTSRALVLAPERFRPWVLEQIALETEAGESGRITIKVNGLTDPEIVDAFYRASQAGVLVELMVRGVCALRPGVAGLSEQVTVRSIVGRVLEHSRIYRFGWPSPEVLAACATRDDPEVPHLRAPEPGARRARYFIGSGDLMERNLDRRIEALAPVLAPELCSRLEDILALDLADDTHTWVLADDGTWGRVPCLAGVNAQVRLQELAVERSRRRHASELAG